MAEKKNEEEASLTVALTTGDWDMAYHSFNTHLALSGKYVGDFIANSLIFVVSRLWSDAIAIYAFGLMSQWYCGVQARDTVGDETYGNIECSARASSGVWALYVLGLIPIAGLLKHLAEWTVEIKENKGEEPPKGCLLVPSILNYVVGWGAGNTLVTVLYELQELSECENCTALNFGFAITCTIIAAVFIILLKPLVEEIECGNTPPEVDDSMPVAPAKCCTRDCVIDWFEDLLEDILAMVSRGFTVIVMMLWVTFLDDLVYQGVDSSAYARVAFIWAGFALFAGSYLSVVLEKVEMHFKPAENETASHVVTSMLEFSNLIQSLLSFAAGCACTNYITYQFSTLNVPPYIDVIIYNVIVTVGLALLCTLWLVVTGESGGLEEGEHVDRDEVEKFFVTNSMAFFVGWNFFIVGRNLIVPLGVMADSYLANNGYSDDHSGIGEKVAVLTGVPVFTYFLLEAAYAFVEMFKEKADIAAHTELLDVPTDPTFEDPGGQPGSGAPASQGRVRQGSTTSSIMCNKTRASSNAQPSIKPTGTRGRSASRAGMGANPPKEGAEAYSRLNDDKVAV